MKTYFTITGTCFHHGQDFFREGMKVRLEKEPDNKYDKEAIKVTMKGLGQVGYVANSPRTVIGDSFSAGRLYDRIGDTAKGKVVMVTGHGILCALKKDKHPAPESSEEIPKQKADEDERSLPGGL